MSKLGDFRVQLLGDIEHPPKEEPEFELSVVRLGHHGEETKGRGSWGWPDDDKIVLLDGIVGEDYSKERVIQVKDWAQTLADKLNSI